MQSRRQNSGPTEKKGFFTYLVPWGGLLQRFRELVTAEPKMTEFRNYLLTNASYIEDSIKYADGNHRTILGKFFASKRFIKDLKMLTKNEEYDLRYSEESFLDSPYANEFEPKPNTYVVEATLQKIFSEINKRLGHLLDFMPEMIYETEIAERLNSLDNIRKQFISFETTGLPLDYEPIATIPIRRPQKVLETVSYARATKGDLIADEPEEVVVPKILKKVASEKVIPKNKKKAPVTEPADEDTSCKLYKVEMMILVDGEVCLSPAICEHDIYSSTFNMSKVYGADESIMIHTLKIEGTEIKLLKVLTSYSIIQNMKMYKFMDDTHLVTLVIDLATENDLKCKDNLTFDNDKLIIVTQVQKTFNNKIACIFRASQLNNMK